MSNINARDIIKYIEKISPPRLAESWDNSGLQIGNFSKNISNVLVCLDVTKPAVKMAVKYGADMIISHHPLIFKRVSKINYQTVQGSIIRDLIKKDIVLYSMHTNFDVAKNGLNQTLAETLGLEDIRLIGEDKTDKFFKLVVFVPKEHLDVVRSAVCRAGAGWIGNYSDCTYSVGGEGTFMPNEGTTPYIGRKGKLERVSEFRLETIIPENKKGDVIDAMLKSHPYEEVAYDLYALEHPKVFYAFGRIGIIEKQPFSVFIDRVKERLYTKSLRIVGDLDKQVESVAVLCGSFGIEIGILKKYMPDVIVTGDLKYHNALELEQEGFCVVDAGHFNTEKLFVHRISELIKERFPYIKVEEYTGTDVFKYV